MLSDKISPFVSMVGLVSGIAKEFLNKEKESSEIANQTKDVGSEIVELTSSSNNTAQNLEIYNLWLDELQDQPLPTVSSAHHHMQKRVQAMLAHILEII